MPTPTNAELLRKAADIMKKRGHAKHELQDDKGRVCLLGALAAAVSGDPHDFASKRPERLLGYVAEYLTRKLRKRINGYGAVDWNNEPTTKINDVIAALRGTARAATR